MTVVTCLLHDTSLALGEGNMATRFVGDELDLNLTSLTTTLLVVVIVVVTGHGGSWSLGASAVSTIASQVITW